MLITISTFYKYRMSWPISVLLRRASMLIAWYTNVVQYTAVCIFYPQFMKHGGLFFMASVPLVKKQLYNTFYHPFQYISDINKILPITRRDETSFSDVPQKSQWSNANMWRHTHFRKLKYVIINTYFVCYRFIVVILLYFKKINSQLLLSRLLFT